MERDYFLRLEFDPDVERYESQPLTLHYRRGRRPCHGWPDVAIWFRPESGRRPELCDVKYRSEIFAKWQRLKPRFRAASQYARTNGMLYRIQSEVEIRTDFLDQAEFLYPYLVQHAPEPAHYLALDGVLRARGPLSAALLLEGTFGTDDERAEALPTLWHLVAAGTFAATPVTTPTMDSVISRLQAE